MKGDQAVYSVLLRKGTMKVIYASTNAGVQRAVSDILDAADWKTLLPRKEDILVKINLTWDYLRPGVNTSPWVVEAFARKVKDHVGRIYLGESSQILVDATRAYAVSRMKDVAEREGLIWHNFSENRWIPREVGDLRFSIPEMCRNMPVISIPVVKTHYRSVISVAMKHLYGCLDDNRHNYHYRLADYVVAVNSLIPVLLTIADGTVSLEGNGPKPGIPKQTDFLAASTDRIALDYSVAEVMGIDPLSVETTMSGNGVTGSYDSIENVCIPPLSQRPSFSFREAAPNFVAKIERRIHGRKKQTVPGTDSPFLGIMKIGAKRWYNLAYYLLGQHREAKHFMNNNKYGPQWKGQPEGVEQ
jgi:uncharacterized protein (DUF362 family)